MAVARTLLGSIVGVVGTVAMAPVLAVGLPFFAVAWLVRRLQSRLEPRSLPWEQLLQYQPVVGWGPRPNLDAYGRADDVFHLTTGPDGWRGTMPLEHADIVVVGDSFAFGHGADDEAMYSQFCDGLRVKPIGSDGYSMVHGLLWLQRLAPQLAGKLVVWFVYCGNDLYENLQPNVRHYRMPFVRRSANTEGWEVATDHVSPEPWPIASPRSYKSLLAEICCPSYLSDRVFSACEYLIRQARDLCHDADARFVVVSVPSSMQVKPWLRLQLAALAPDAATFDADLPDKKLQESCHRLGVPFVPLKAHLTARDYQERDIHWTAEGNRRVGSILSDVFHNRLPAWPTSPDAGTATLRDQEAIR